MKAGIPAIGRRVRILKPSSEYRDKVGKLIEELPTGEWWVAFGKRGNVLEVMSIKDFEVLPVKE